MSGGGGGGGAPRPPAQAAARGWRRKQHQTPSHPLDIVQEIAARSDPATLVRGAAMCSDVRRRVEGGGKALRLRHADRFVPSLLRGHVEPRYDINYYNATLHYLVDITGPDTTARVLTAADGFPPPPDGKKLRQRWHDPLASRDGLLLVRTTDWGCQPPREELRVCDLATGRSQTLPPEPTFAGAAQNFWEPYVLLDGDGEAGGASGIRHPFQVLKANLVMSYHRRYLETQTFSSEKGAWGGRPLVAGGAVHWLCLTTSGGYVLKLHIRTSQVTVMALPVSFPCSSASGWGTDYLATATAGRELMVLVLISTIWAQQTK
ncbi:hypothetical protein PVAP13_2NG623100 [Panicum virgatum]|uniref:DUF7595 domain-containing protein n=1 Tax=Panicum virgatum TaxID=38727 RepID=A0A8T0VUN4_PANVG|nr:hypothetical protein PVAP13_2NG623100 [Panicum virgatum]